MTTIATTPKEMRTFFQKPGVQTALRDGAQIGKWTDPATGATEINITDILPNEAAARSLGIQRGQKAIGRLRAGEYLGDINLQQTAAQGDDILSPLYRKDPLRGLFSGQGSLGF